MQDWLTMGYYIVASDIPIRNGMNWDFPDGGERFTTEEDAPVHSGRSHPAQLMIPQSIWETDTVQRCI
ncbi:MAG: hypothetical protein CM15mP96_2390 [Gammaproteobacteria bacterium]|nr:MAG: hypothetical protein CM15mP96_2390 [Gammaproteobacteria bacterium]